MEVDYPGADVPDIDFGDTLLRVRTGEPSAPNRECASS
jgi:hypothetical protein